MKPRVFSVKGCSQPEDVSVISACEYTTEYLRHGVNLVKYQQVDVVIHFHSAVDDHDGSTSDMHFVDAVFPLLLEVLCRYYNEKSPVVASHSSLAG